MDTEYMKQLLERISFTPFPDFTFKMKQWPECMPFIGKDWCEGINKVKILFLSGWTNLNGPEIDLISEEELFNDYAGFVKNWYKQLRHGLAPIFVDELSYAKNVDKRCDVHVSKIEDALKSVFPQAGDDVLRKAGILRFWVRPMIRWPNSGNRQEHHNFLDEEVSLNLLREVVRIMEPDCIIACGSGIRQSLIDGLQAHDIYRMNGFWNTITFNFQDGTSHECGLIMSDENSLHIRDSYSMELKTAIRTAALMDKVHMNWAPRRNHG